MTFGSAAGSPKRVQEKDNVERVRERFVIKVFN